jgi:hypothetical protein
MSMSTTPARPLPRWLILVGSLGIAFHLLAVIAMVLAAPSGNWPSPYGRTMQEPPAFAASIGEVTTRFYLQPLHLAHNYHFRSNRTDMSSVRFKVRLKDRTGEEIGTFEFPEADVNPWVRQRQNLLALSLADDLDVTSNNPNSLPEPGQEIPRVQIWEQSKAGQEYHLKNVAITSLSRERPFRGPSRWSQLLAKSYIRYLVHKYGADAGELIRESREPIPPVVLIAPPLPDQFNEMVADFTERQP